jgi:Cdc6-like AAA superfamily ATPase
MKFSTSVNIERDNNKVLNYIVTANARQAIGTIVNSFTTGIHSFCLIGSYGTGKSSFILALQSCLSGKVTGKNLLFNNKGQFNEYKNFEFLNIVGDYQPLISLLQKYVSSSDTNEKNFFNALDNLYKKVQKQNKFLFIVIDEFGKVLEHAAKNNPERKCTSFRNSVSMLMILAKTLFCLLLCIKVSLLMPKALSWSRSRNGLK